MELGRDDTVALCTAGYALTYLVGEVERGEVCLDRAVSLNRNLAIALGINGG